MTTKPIEEMSAEDWSGMDGATAWHLIDRHGDSFEHVGKMMDAWIAANRSAPVISQTEAMAAPVAQAEPTGYIWRHKATFADAAKAFGPEKNLDCLWRYTHGTEDLEAIEAREDFDVIRLYGQAPAHGIKENP